MTYTFSNDLNMFEVQWDRWYRCGRYGDDKDYEEMRRTFNTIEEANSFVDDLVDGKHRGIYDITVHRHEVKIVEKSA
jgi:hypothetical protein